MVNLPNETLKQILVNSGYLSASDFDEAVKRANQLNKKIEDILIFQGYLDEETLGKLIAEYLKVNYVNVGRLVIPDDILFLIPEKLARWYRMVPFAKEGQSLKMAMENPHNFEALEFAKRQTGLQIIPFFTTQESLMKAFGQYKKNLKEYFGKIIADNIKKASIDQDLAKAAENLPIIKILDSILEYAVAEHASDVHIETQDKNVLVRFRIDGILQDIVSFPRGIESALIARIKILSNLKIDEHRIPQDGRFKFKVDEEIIGLRVSIIPSFYAENAVLRLLPESKRPLSLEELGFSASNLLLIRDNIKKPHGMILVTGPTGSGKTTTLYSLLNILNNVEVKICTIEDPIEYGIERVNQIQVNPKTGLTFAAGLRALLRHDPDIIMVGEIRDNETAEIAIHAALTGHLVLSTLHTNDAAGAIPRLLDMGVESFLLASTLNVVVAQRLVRKICPNCIREFQPSEETLNLLRRIVNFDISAQRFYKGEGCDECHHSGYTGRIGIYEVLPMSEKIKKLVIQKGASDQIQKEAVAEGMVTMLHDGINKVSAGLTTIEEVLRAVREE